MAKDTEADRRSHSDHYADDDGHRQNSREQRRKEQHQACHERMEYGVDESNQDADDNQASLRQLSPSYTIRR
jgi:hypothetical protein